MSVVVSTCALLLPTGVHDPSKQTRILITPQANWPRGYWFLDMQQVCGCCRAHAIKCETVCLST